MSRINLYNDGSYTVDRGWTTPTYPYITLSPEDIGRDGEDARREPFIWKTDDGRLMLVEDMHTNHLINAINMIWGNIFGTRTDRPEIMGDWSSAYVDRATREFSKELQKRVEDA